MDHGLQGPLIEVQYDLNVEDIVALRRYMATRPEKLRIQRWIRILVIAGVVGVLVVVPLLEGTTHILPYLLATLILAPLLYAVVSSAFGWDEASLRRQLKKQFDEMGGFNGGKPMTFVLSPQGYAVLSPDRSEVLKWPSVTSVIPAGEQVFFLSGDGIAHIVAEHMFPAPEQFAEFVDRVLEYYERSRAPAPS